MPYDPSAYRVQYDIATEFEEIRFALDQNRVVTPLEHVPNMAMCTIEPCRVDAVQMPHTLPEIRLSSLQHEMVVIRHLAPGMALPVIAFTRLAQQCQPAAAIDLVQIDCFATIAACCDVIEPAGELDA